MKRLTIDQLVDIQPSAAFFDIDGTLAPIAAHADLVTIDSDMLCALDTLEQLLGGALGILSGRPLTEIDRLLHARKFPVAAEHGAIIRGAGHHKGDSQGMDNIRRGGITADRQALRPVNPCGVDHFRPDEDFDVEALYQLACDALHHQTQGMHSHQASHALSNHTLDARYSLTGLRVERKQYGIALHYRSAPHAQAMVIDVARQLSAAYPSVSLLHGKMVVELQRAGFSKGDALCQLSSQAPFKGRCPIVFGDDVTDETAFRQAQAMGGVGIKIGTEPSSHASFFLPEQSDLLPLLHQWITSLNNASPIV